MSKLRLVIGSILDAEEDVIVQQVNCQGVMGAGLAKQLRAKHTLVYTDYKRYTDCFKTNPRELLGNLQLVNVGENKYVGNMFAQFSYGRDKNICYTDYDALHECFIKLKRFVSERNLTVAIPHGIGAGLANGDWFIIRGIIEDVFKDDMEKIRVYQLK